MKKSIEPPARPVQEKKPVRSSSQKSDKEKIHLHKERVEDKEKKIKSSSVSQQDPEHEARIQLLRPYLEADKRTYTGDPW
jgi:hypothetical protein